MRASNLLLILLFTVTLTYVGCKRSENESDTANKAATTERADNVGEKVEDDVKGAVEKSEEMHAAQVAELNKKAPSEIATELWNLIQTEEYQHWKEVPSHGLITSNDGKTKTNLKTYANDLAYQAMQNKARSLPPGSIMVKERYDDQDQLQAISAMINLGGNDPKDINWFWAQYSPDGKPLKMGQTGKGAKSSQ